MSDLRLAVPILFAALAWCQPAHAQEADPLANICGPASEFAAQMVDQQGILVAAGEASGSLMQIWTDANQHWMVVYQFPDEGKVCVVDHGDDFTIGDNPKPEPKGDPL